MRTILNLFGRSPFAPMLTHMDIVSACVQSLPPFFEALYQRDYAAMEKKAEEIATLEHKADLTKNDIRNNLPKSLFLAIDRSYILEILALQDSIADKTEDIAVLTTLKQLEMYAPFKEDFDRFLVKNIETFNGAKAIIYELHQLLESSFGGNEAEKVRSMVDDVAFHEHEADLIQRSLLKKLFSIENEKDMHFSTFLLWQKIFQAVGDISNLSEKLGFRVRMTLDLKP